MSPDISQMAQLFYVLFMLATLVFCIIGEWKMLEKAGEHGWAVLIPFYGLYVMSKVAFGNGWFMLLQFIPCVGIIVNFAQFYKIGKRFGKGTAFNIGLIFLTPVFMMILGFDDSTYN